MWRRANGREDCDVSGFGALFRGFGLWGGSMGLVWTILMFLGFALSVLIRV